MFIKIKPGVFVNTDDIALVEIYDDRASLTLRSGGNFQIPIEAAGYLLDQLEVSSAVVFPGEELTFREPARPVKMENLTGGRETVNPAQPLRSRIAQLLRDRFVQGATLEQLNKEVSGTYNETYSAVSDLIAERVVIYEDNKPLVYYHATHRPGQTVPAPEIDLIPAAGIPDFNPLNPLLVQAMRQGELQCTECAHQSCATCVTARACCKCDQPAFTKFTPPAASFTVNTFLCAHNNTPDTCFHCDKHTFEAATTAADFTAPETLDKTNGQLWLQALEQTLAYLKDSEGRAGSHNGYFSSGWAGRTLAQLRDWLKQQHGAPSSIPDPSTVSEASALRPAEDTGSTLAQTTDY